MTSRFSRVVLSMVAGVVLAFASTAQRPPNMTVTDSQTGGGSAQVTFAGGPAAGTWTATNGDSGTWHRIGPANSGNYTWVSNCSGGNGILQKSGGQWAWQNNETGAGGTGSVPEAPDE